MTSFLSTIEEIEKSQAFANFKKKHPDAYFCAGFFVLNYESQEEQIQKQLDYSLKDGKIFTFILDKEITIKEAETIEGKQQKLPELNKEVKVDLDDVEKILQEELNQKKLKKPLKVIAILQQHEKKEIWNLNCVLPGMEILRVHIDSESGNIIKFEKKNMFDFIKKIK